MYLYSLTLQKATGSNVAIVGSFSAPKVHELAVRQARRRIQPDRIGFISFRLTPFHFFPSDLSFC